MENIKSSAIITIVNKGYADEVMAAARTAGATGGTIIHARGTSSIEAEKFLGIAIEPEKDLVLILSPNTLRQDIMSAIYKKTGLFKEGNGFSISLPVDEMLGLAFINNDDEEGQA